MKSLLYVMFLRCIEGLPGGQQGLDTLQTSKLGLPGWPFPFFGAGTVTVEHVV